MKITLLLLLIFTTGLFATETYSQTAKINIVANNRPVNQILQEIEKQTDFLFVYNPDEINLTRRMSVDVKEEKIADVLFQLFNHTDIMYVVEGNNVMLLKRPVMPQQNKRSVTGVIADESGIPIIGANVIEKGTTNGNITDIDGKFTLQVSPGAILQVSYIGYLQEEIPIGNQATFTIMLKEDTQILEEVVVVGYGTVKKKDLTGAVGSVKGDEIASRKTMEISTALQGAMAGVMVTRSSNEPGASGTIRVRGVTTIGDSSPLYIIDGVPGDMNMVNPNDVESISVLKDAASASIYGSRAAAGVILITTKRAKENQLALDYSFEYGWEMPTSQPKFVDVQRYMQMTNELRWNDAGNGTNEYPLYAKDVIDNYLTLNVQDPDTYPDTDWTDLILKSLAPRQSHILSISGGTAKVRTKASIGYDKSDGLYEDRYWERLMLRINNDFTINKYLGASLDVNFRRVKAHRPYADNIFDWMRFAAPVYAAEWSDGRVGEGKSGNNIYGITKYGGNRDNYYNQLGGKVSVDLTPIEGLKFSAILAPTFNYDKAKNFRKAIPYYAAKDPSVRMGYLEGYSTTMLTENRNDQHSITTQFIGNYNKTFGEHDLSLMAGYENYYFFREELSASRDKYELDSYPYLDIGPLELRNNGGKAYETAYRSWFGRVMYSYKHKYLLQANIRYDGSSRFHKDYRWGAFPSFSAGWVMTEENFMKDVDWLSFLKLRASWGQLGNERIGNYPYQSTIGFSNSLFYLGNSVVSKQTAAQIKYAIQNISWETTESTDIGFDANFLNNRLRFNFDYFYKKTKDMLLALEIPDYMGFENPDQNTGEMETKGFEVELGWNDKIGDLDYSVSVNLSDFKSKMGDLGGTEFLGDKVKKKGTEFDEWYGYKAAGLFQTQEDVNNSPKLNNNVRPGDIKYLDISGPDGVPDGRISPEYDRVPLGGSLPRYMFGGNIQLAYRGFDLSMAFQGVGKQNSRITAKMIQPLQVNWGHIPAILEGNYWSMYNTAEQNKTAKYPRLTWTNTGSNFTQMSDYYMFNGRYFRMKNITLGYTIPSFITDKVSINRTRIYVSASDLFCISKYPEGWDPEMGDNSYPITTSVLLGLSVNF